MSARPDNGGPEVITLGCRLNAYESEVIRQRAAEAGLGDAVIINSCAVTGEAVRQARQAVRRARRAAPDRPVIVTGCAAQIDPETFAAMPEVTSVIGNREKLTAAPYQALAGGRLERVRVNDIFDAEESAGHLIAGFGSRARAFVQIQNGCNHRCTFCIIPYGRGNSRSVAMGEVVRQIETLVDEGYSEVVLTGVDLTSYGEDLPGAPCLGTLVEKILTLVPGLVRLRLSSIDSIEVDPLLFEIITGEARLMPHLHLSLQSGDDMILKRMKRRHSRADALDFVESVRARRPATAFGADLIAGFPTEDETMFENSLRLVGEAGLAHVHVFPYSPRPGTPAARMPQVPAPVRKARAAALRAAGAAELAALMARRAGTAAVMLVERAGAGEATGHSEDFLPLRLEQYVEPGRLIPVRLGGEANGLMLAHAADRPQAAQ